MLFLIGLGLLLIGLILLRYLAPPDGERPHFMSRSGGEFAAIFGVQIPILSGLGIAIGAALNWISE